MQHVAAAGSISKHSGHGPAFLKLAGDSGIRARDAKIAYGGASGKTVAGRAISGSASATAAADVCGTVLARD